MGLNFRDVLNVLGEYPGDPGPPGGDCAGMLSAVGSEAAGAEGPAGAVLGFASAPLAHVARSDARLLGPKPTMLAFQQACTVPAVWCTSHEMLARARLRTSLGVLVHASAGGVGLAATEYANWLAARTEGSAGRPLKHRLACSVRSMSSSRDGEAFAAGSGRAIDPGVVLVRDVVLVRVHRRLRSLPSDAGHALPAEERRHLGGDTAVGAAAAYVDYVQLVGHDDVHDERDVVPVVVVVQIGLR